jgi:UDPglucose 6-dehydrogenase
MRRPRIVELRNIFNPEELRSLGFGYEGVGRRRVLNPSVTNKLLGNNSKIGAHAPEFLGSSSHVSEPA